MGWGTGLSFPPPTHTPYRLNDEENILTRLHRSIIGFLTLSNINAQIC